MAPKNPMSSNLEFQSLDDAWYSVRLVLKRETIIVKYCDFSDEHDGRYKAADYKDPKKLEDFIAKFRPTSIQLQDNECKKVIEGKTVCASYVFNEDEIKFYDAVVEEVKYKDHKFVKEEECTCTFVLFWLYGPNEGNKSDSVIDQICLLQPGNVKMDPSLSRFQEICRQKHKVDSHCSGFECETLTYDIPTNHDAITNSTVKDKLCSPQFESHARSLKEVKTLKHPFITSQKLERRNLDKLERNEQKDPGGNYGLVENPRETSTIHYMLIENLEKDLASSDIVDFIEKHLSITSKAQVFPSLSSESYTRGIVVVNRQEELLKIFDFLHSPAHMILSPTGRPWVITEKTVWAGVVRETIGNVTVLSKSPLRKKIYEFGEKIRIVSCNSEEYNKGKELKDLFLEFSDHQQGLCQQYAFEESKLLGK